MRQLQYCTVKQLNKQAIQSEEAQIEETRGGWTEVLPNNCEEKQLDFKRTSPDTRSTSIESMNLKVID